MKKSIFLICISFLLVLLHSCKKDKKDPPKDPSGSNFEMKEIQIVVPANSTFKPAGSKVFSFALEQTADATGKAKVAFEKGSSTLAYVFDDNKRPILAGFITDSTNIISPATTAKVLLYLGYNIPLQPDTLSAYFLNNIDKLQGAVLWVQEFETLFLSDPLTLSNKSFLAPLKERMAQMIDQTPPIDIYSKAADIHVDANDIRSGIQVSDDGLSQFKVINNYRRRAHAFLYKMSYKDMNGSPFTVKNSIDKTTVADMNEAISPVSAVTGFLSEIGKTIEGKGLESFAVTSGPFPLELQNNESEARYKLRIVGPGAIPKSNMTDAETDKLIRLSFETFLLDIVIPAVGIITSIPKKPVTGAFPDVEKVSKTDALITFVKAMPDVYEEVKKANYKEALKKLLENVYKDGTGHLMNGLFKIALNKEIFTGNVSSFFNIKFERLLQTLALADAAIGASDLIRVEKHVFNSAYLEEWEIKAKAGLITLSPDKSVVVPYQQQKMTATIKNNTQQGYYEWGTTGIYGKLTDTKGHTDLANFSSTDKDVFYVSKVSQASLSDGDNIDYIYVKAFAGGIEVGTDTVMVNVKKTKFVMKPTGATVSGKEGSANSIKLYLENTDALIKIPSSNTSYKIIWTTAGKYGKLNGVGTTGVNTLTEYDNNTVSYECLDKDTKTATETINVRIYSKAKTAPESEYKLFDELSGSVKIDNDPTKIVYYAAPTAVHRHEVNACGTGCVLLVKKVPNAISYKVEITGLPNPLYPMYSETWAAGDPNHVRGYGYALYKEEEAGDDYIIGITGTVSWSGAGPNYPITEHFPLPQCSGIAKVTVTVSQ